MNLFIIILLMNCVYLFGKKIYKKQLRGMTEENLVDLRERVFKLINDTLNEYNGTKN